MVSSDKKAVKGGDEFYLQQYITLDGKILERRTRMKKSGIIKLLSIIVITSCTLFTQVFAESSYIKIDLSNYSLWTYYDDNTGTHQVEQAEETQREGSYSFSESGITINPVRTANTYWLPLNTVVSNVNLALTNTINISVTTKNGTDRWDIKVQNNTTHTWIIFSLDEYGITTDQYGYTGIKGDLTDGVFHLPASWEGTVDLTVQFIVLAYPAGNDFSDSATLTSLELGEIITSTSSSEASQDPSSSSTQSSISTVQSSLAPTTEASSTSTQVSSESYASSTTGSSLISTTETSSTSEQATSDSYSSNISVSNSTTDNDANSNENNNNVIIVVVVLALLIIGGAVAFFIIKRKRYTV